MRPRLLAGAALTFAVVTSTTVSCVGPTGPSERPLFEDQITPPPDKCEASWDCGALDDNSDTGTGGFCPGAAPYALDYCTVRAPNYDEWAIINAAMAQMRRADMAFIVAVAIANGRLGVYDVYNGEWADSHWHHDVPSDPDGRIHIFHDLFNHALSDVTATLCHEAAHLALADKDHSQAFWVAMWECVLGN